MSHRKMHAGEIDINEPLVKQLLQEQFPQWAELPLTRVPSAGTDHAIYKLGVDMCVRLPRIAGAAKHVEKEQYWLSRLAPHLPLAVPVPLGQGIPQERYPWPWSICRWLEGGDATAEKITDMHQAAVDLAQFIKSLQQIDSVGGPTARRGQPLATQDTAVQNALESLHGAVDTQTAALIWRSCLDAPIWHKPPVWIHGDLLPANLLVQNGHLSAVIDFELMGVGDPACDLIPAWSLFSSDTRDVFRATLGVVDATWMRGKGWALSIALIILPYYQNTNPGLFTVGKRMLDEVLADRS
ncbi:MAG: aminoglycoside phosphotransferase family protein [Pseudomonadota bacterium]